MRSVGFADGLEPLFVEEAVDLEGGEVQVFDFEAEFFVAAEDDDLVEETFVVEVI